MAQWQLYQIGFRSADLPEYMARPTYDIGSIYSGLLSRAKRLYRALPSPRPQTSKVFSAAQVTHRLGLAFSAGADEPLWVLLPTSDGGYAIGLTMSATLGAWWMKCVTDPEELRTAAEEMLDRFDPEGTVPLLVTHYGDTQLLSAWDEENKAWNTMGELSSRLIRGHEHQMDWLRIDALSSGMQPPDSTETPRPDSKMQIKYLLQRCCKIAEVRDIQCTNGVVTRTGPNATPRMR